MRAVRFDCVVVGAGPAGISAATRLSRGGLSVLVLEAGVYPGAENWSGAVYFTENLERPEVFGADTISRAPFERRVVQRGVYLYNGHSLIGAAYRDREAFGSSYTVLRPVYDRFLAEMAREHGVMLATSTTAESLIRADGAVIGVMTDRGPVYADVVFLAEGDASHLTSQEGYDADLQHGPHFLQGVKEVIRLPQSVLEERFGLSSDEGACFEFLIRNAVRRGKTCRLNMGGFIYTNQDSLSLGFVLPLDNLRDQFDGNHNLLLEWVKGLPQVARWIAGGEPISFGTKIIRVGSSKSLPQMVDDGLAIGGAATGIGVDFPCPNYTGPATEMGALFARGLLELRRAGRPPTAENLSEVYVERLKLTHYFKNVVFLDNWPDYVERTTTFFESQVDLACSLGYIATRPSWSEARKLWESVRTIRIALPPAEIPMAVQDMLRLAKAVHLERLILSALSPVFWPFWIANTVLCWIPSRKPKELGLTFIARAGAESSGGQPPWFVRWYWSRFCSSVSACFRHVYTNDRTPLEQKLIQCCREVSRRVSLIDLLLLPVIAAALAAIGVGQLVLEVIRKHILRQPFERRRKGRSWQIALDAASQRRLEEDCIHPTETYEAKLGRIQYLEGHASHIQVFWPESIDQRAELAESSLWSVCPAKVYERERVPIGAPSVVVNFENCIKCESCWRATEDVHWSRATNQRLIYETYPPSLERLFRYLSERSDPQPRPPAEATFGEGWIERQRPALEEWMESLDCRFDSNQGRQHWERVSRLCGKMTELVSGLERTIEQFGQALVRELRTLGTGRLAWFDELLVARESVMREFSDSVEQLKQLGLRGRLPVPGFFEVVRDMELLSRSCRRHAAARRFFWVDVIGRQLLAHHLGCIRLFLETIGGRIPLGPGALSVEAGYFEQKLEPSREAIRTQLNGCFGNQQLRALEHGSSLDDQQRELLQDLLTGVQRDDSEEGCLQLLEELARYDPALAYMVSHQLHARRLLDACGVHEAVGGSRWMATALAGAGNLIPTALADDLLVCGPDGLYIGPVDMPGLSLTPKVATGLRGADLAWVNPPNPVGADVVSRVQLPDGVDHHSIWLRTGIPLHAAICRGACGYLFERACEHAVSRIQFGQAFQDEQGVAGVGKFGAVKQMIAEMALGGYVMDTLREPGELPGVVHLLLVKLTAAKSFGPHPGSAAYNAGQVFGGTAFSEDDVLAKYYRDSGMFRYLVARDDALRTSLAQSFLAAQVRQEGWVRPASDLADLALLRRRGILVEALDSVDEAGRQLNRALSKQGWIRQRAARATEVDPVLALLGGALVQWLAARAILLRTHRLLEVGVPARMEVQAVRLASDRLGPELREALAACAEARRLIAFGQRVRDQRFWDDVPQTRCEGYQAVVESSPPFRSGEFLVTRYDPLRPRHLPERLWGDPALCSSNQDLKEYFRETYYNQEYDGLSYGRHLEKLHRLPEADIKLLHDRGYLRMFIPSAQGGAGLPKAYYYMLLLQSMRYADPAYALIIMANSSIGTTPILIGLKQDIPRVERELQAVADDSSFLREIEVGIERVVRRLRKRRDLRRIQMRFKPLAEIVDRRIQRSTVLKYLASGFLYKFGQARQALGHSDMERVEHSLLQAREMLEGLQETVSQWLGELPRQRRAHEMFLRLIAHGQMSSFSLTEPTAGSDSGGVKTQASLCRRPVRCGKDGRLTYQLDRGSGDDHRVLIDADRLVFRDRRIWYRHTENADPVEIHYDEYDYETDGKKTRYYMHDGQRYEFDDIGQLRLDEEGGLYWDYYELTGAKMWITNGRFTGVTALYALTPEGVTGFMVDRHAEGFVVGADEEKLGQKGSPTNELSLSAVRVAAENVIGCVGRGQVNALETLNVGRGGLCVSTVGVCSDMIHRALALELPGEIAAYQVGQIAAELLGKETMAHELIGFFDSRQGDTVRVESAIGKYHATEALHRAISAAEDLRGLSGTTFDHDIEKKRRDARILNIYEGTNEVQRFLLLKDLTSYLLDRYRRGSKPLADGTPRGAFGELEQKIEQAKDRLFARVGSLKRRHGDQLWQNPSYQPIFFPLAEVAGEIKLADAMLYRIDWLTRSEIAGTPHAALVTELGQLVIERALSKIDRLFERLERSYQYVAKEHYPPEVQLASLALEDSEPQHDPPLAALPLRLDHSIEVLVPIVPSPMVAPQPRIVNGELRELTMLLSAADRVALRAASRLKSQAPRQVRITAVGVASSLGRDAIREAGALGADRCLYVPVDQRPLTTSEIGNALLEAVQQRQLAPDLVLCGDAPGEGTGQTGLAAFLAAALEAQTLLEAGRLTFRSEGGRLVVHGGSAAWEAEDQLEIELPAVISFPQKERVPLDYSLDRWVSAACEPLSMIRTRPAKPAMSVSIAPLRLEPDTDSRRVTTPEEAAELFVQLADASLGSGTEPERRDIEPHGFDQQEAEGAPAVLAFLPPAVGPELTPHARAAAAGAAEVAGALQLALDIVVPIDCAVTDLALLSGALVDYVPRRIYVINQSHVERFSARGLQQLFARFLNEYSGIPRAVISAGPLNPVLAALARRYRAPFWFGVDRISDGSGPLTLVTRALGGCAEALAQPVRTDQLFLASVNPGLPYVQPTVMPCLPELFVDRLPIEYGLSSDPFAMVAARYADGEPEVGLASAEYILDVGYGIKTREQLEQVIDPLLEILVTQMGLERSMIGATRKVTQDLKILPMDRQIGQTGVRVAPKVLVAAGVSGAPQHIDYISPETVILCFNSDPNASLMRWNIDHPKPVVHPIRGDLFETLRVFTEQLRSLCVSP